jgi:hypothetical protein
MDLSAGNITIKRCWIQPVSIDRGNSLVISFDNNNNTAPAPAMVTLRDCDIDGSAVPDM